MWLKHFQNILWKNERKELFIEIPAQNLISQFDLKWMKRKIENCIQTNPNGADVVYVHAYEWFGSVRITNINMSRHSINCSALLLFCSVPAVSIPSTSSLAGCDGGRRRIT